MDILTKLLPENLYHSYIVEGNPDETPLSLRSFFEVRGDIEVQSSDVLYQIYDSLSMDDVSKIKEWHSTRGITNGKKICIIGLKFINREAEQALLKIIEEPQVGTHFFFVIPNSAVLSSTILSRVHVIKINGDENDVDSKKFFSFKPVERIEMIAEIIKEYKDSEGSGMLRFKAIEIINGLEKILHEKFKLNKSDKNLQFILEELAIMRAYLQTPGASVKMILEHIALVL
jgi:DNA polymerase III delta prime subunit